MLTDAEWTALQKDVTQFLRKRGALARKLCADATQEALLRLFQHLSDGKEIKDRVNWCKVTAWHIVQRWKTTEERHVPVINIEEGDERPIVPIVDTQTPERQLIARLELARVSPRVIDMVEGGETMSMKDRQILHRERQRLREED